MWGAGMLGLDASPPGSCVSEGHNALGAPMDAILRHQTKWQSIAGMGGGGSLSRGRTPALGLSTSP